MAGDESFSIAIGTHGTHEWLVADSCLVDLLELCPQTVLGKYIAITSIDSGSYFPNVEENAAGWKNHGGIAYSPQISTVDEVPAEGWDEWWIFKQPTDIGILAPRDRNPFEGIYEREINAFVNSNVDLRRDCTDLLIELFWKQFDWIRPLTYISESGTHLTFISADKNLFEEVHQALGELDNSPE
jgi:hypothetical protein